MPCAHNVVLHPIPSHVINSMLFCFVHVTAVIAIVGWLAGWHLKWRWLRREKRQRKYELFIPFSLDVQCRDFIVGIFTYKRWVDGSYNDSSGNKRRRFTHKKSQFMWWKVMPKKKCMEMSHSFSLLRSLSLALFSLSLSSILIIRWVTKIVWFFSENKRRNGMEWKTEWAIVKVLIFSINSNVYSNICYY